MRPTESEMRGIYAGIEGLPLKFDPQGWNSETNLFGDVMRMVCPREGMDLTVIEVGVWKGASLLHMGRLARARKLKAFFYAVDIWYGPHNGAIGHAPDSQIPERWDVPSLYQLFLFNMKHEGLDDRVLPVWNFTRWGSRMLAHWGVVADLIYVDAAHDEEFVWADLNDYWPLLRRGGVMFGDDLTYPGVAAALGRFVEKEGVVLNKTDGQWWILKGA